MRIPTLSARSNAAVASWAGAGCSGCALVCPYASSLQPASYRRDQLSALQADATFTVPLLDGMEVLQLNIWREMMRRTDWEEIPLPAGDA